MIHLHPQIIGWVCLVSGLAIRLLIGKRRFDRRGAGGLQHFSNYWIALLTFFLEWLLKWASYVLIPAGLLLLLFE